MFLKKKYNIPDQLMTNLKTALYSIKPQFYEKIDFKEKYYTGFTKRIFGIVKRVNDQFILAIANGDTSGKLYIKYNSIKVQKCKNLLFIKKCHYEYEKKPKGYSQNELNIIENALDIQFKITLKNCLKKLDKNYQTIISSNFFLYSMSGKIGMQLHFSGSIDIKKLRVNYEFNNGIEETYSGFDKFSKTGIIPYFLKISERGNLMKIDNNNNILWESKTEGKGIGPYSIFLTEDGNFLLVDSRNYPIFDKDNKLTKYENVIIQDVKLFSDNKKNYGILSNDSSFISYEITNKEYDITGNQIFEREDSDDRGVPPYYAVVDNGYFKVIDSKENILYKSNYFGNYDKPGCIKITNDGYIVVVDNSGRIVWKYP